MVNGAEDRSLIQINVFFNTDSNKVLTLGIKKATLPCGYFPERFAVKQMAILLDTGQNVNSHCSSVANGARITLDIHTVSLGGAKMFIVFAQGCNCSKAVSSCGMHRSGGLL